MQTLMALKSVWFEISFFVCLALYFIGGYLEYWEIEIGTYEYKPSSLNVQPDGSVNYLPIGYNTKLSERR